VIRGFNSFPVRLKVKGFLPTQMQRFCFNSFPVRLKEKASAQKKALKIRFNSFPVRLKEFNPLLTLQLTRWFQFLSGSIKSFQNTNKLTDTENSFNSFPVRLKVLLMQLKQKDLYLVSIPFRFD